MSSVLRYPVQLSAGVDFPLICDGTIVYFENGADAITVNTGKDSAVLQPGQGFRASERFTRLRINSDTAQNASIYISDTDIIDNRLVFASSSIEASVGNDTKNTLISTYIGGWRADESGAAGTPTEVYFENDTAGDLYITRMGMEAAAHSGGGLPASLVWQMRVSEGLTGGSVVGRAFEKSDIFDVNDDVGNFYSSANPPTITGQSRAISIGAISDLSKREFFSSSEPLKLSPGNVLRVENSHGGQISFTLELKPSAAAQNASGDGLDYIELGYTDASISGGILYGNTLASLRDVLGVMQSASAADLANPASSINTDKKYLGKQVINTDTGAVVVAQGSAANATWVNAV